MYEPSTSTSLFRASPMRALVPRSSESAEGHGADTRRLETSSPETSRNLSPPESSVLNISERAAASQASSARPDRFCNPSTATDLRICTEDTVGLVPNRPYYHASPTPIHI